MLHINIDIMGAFGVIINRQETDSLQAPLAPCLCNSDFHTRTHTHTHTHVYIYIYINELMDEYDQLDRSFHNEDLRYSIYNRSDVCLP